MAVRFEADAGGSTRVLQLILLAYERGVNGFNLKVPAGVTEAVHASVSKAYLTGQDQHRGRRLYGYAQQKRISRAVENIGLLLTEGRNNE